MRTRASPTSRNADTVGGCSCSLMPTSSSETPAARPSVGCGRGCRRLWCAQSLRFRAGRRRGRGSLPRRRRTGERDARKHLKNWPPGSRELICAAVTASQSFAVDYKHLLRNRLEGVGAEIVDYPPIEHRKIARRAIARSAPFDDEGNGCRDALHWYTFIGLLLACEPEDPHAYLLGG